MNTLLWCDILPRGTETPTQTKHHCWCCYSNIKKKRYLIAAQWHNTAVFFWSCCLKKPSYVRYPGPQHHWQVWCTDADSSILVKCAPTVRELLIFIPFNKRTVKPLSVERDEAQQAASGGDFLSVSYSDIIILTCFMGFNGLAVGQNLSSQYLCANDCWMHESGQTH